MPNGNRFQLSVNGVKYDFSLKQVEMISKKTLNLKTPLEYYDEKRVNGLVSKRLLKREGWTTKSVKYSRTKLGEEIFKALASQLL